MTAPHAAGKEPDMDTAVATYNGWSNRETWLASLWLSNDESYLDLLSEAEKLKGDTYNKAEWLEERLQNAFCELYGDASFWTDLLGTALSRVNWYELVEKN